MIYDFVFFFSYHKNKTESSTFVFFFSLRGINERSLEFGSDKQF